MAIRIASGLSSGFSRYEEATDEQLLCVMKLGDERALDCLMQRYRGLVWRVVKTYLGSLTEAEDILQDISLTLYQNRDVYQTGSAKFSSWLYRVAANKCLDLLKSSRGKTVHTEISEALPDHLPTAEEELLRAQVAKQLSELLALLPSQQKMALSLYYYEGMEVGEIGEKLSLSETAVRALMKRGKEKLRTLSTAQDF